MEPNKPKTGALDFFLHLGVIVVLYAGVGFLLNLLFTIINVAYPQVDYYGYSQPISFPVAALLVLFPLYILLSWFTYRSYSFDPNKKQLSVRKWLTYLTLFVTGAVMAGDLITVIYYFLDGRDFTASFVLKALSVLVVTSIVFGYYIQDLRDKVSSAKRKTWLIITAVIVLGSIVLGFLVIGSPQTQRLLRYDNQKLMDIQNLQSQIISYWQSKGSLPKDLNALKDSLSYNTIPLDPQTAQAYEYSVKGAMSFELCAGFNKDSTTLQAKQQNTNAIYYGGMQNENWQYKQGRYCFERTVDPQRYPVNPKPVF